MTKALQFANLNPSLSLPEGVTSAVLMLVFEDGSIHVSIPIGSEESATQTMRAGLELFTLGSGEHAELHTVGTSSAPHGTTTIEA